MSIFANRDVKRLFVKLSCGFAAFIFLSQLHAGLTDGEPDVALLGLSLLLAAAVFFACFFFFQRQRKMIENAMSQMQCFASGDSGARIESVGEGCLHKLFHEVNALATTLNTHAVREQNTKDFLRNTISDISHQLKTPLAALEIYNSLLREECGDAAVVNRFALKSEKELERMETLVQNLLKITRLDTGSVIMDRQPENISDMMNDLKARFEIRAEREHKELILSGADDIGLLCDRSWLIEAVSNIVKNALDHTEAGGQIRIDWSGRPLVAQIAIKDDGSGIRQEDIHHIFKRFYRSGLSKGVQGIGLGLPLSKAIVEAHDGNITVDSAPGGGSTFVLSFLKLTKS